MLIDELDELYNTPIDESNPPKWLTHIYEKVVEFIKDAAFYKKKDLIVHMESLCSTAPTFSSKSYAKEYIIRKLKEEGLKAESYYNTGNIIISGWGETPKDPLL